MERHLQTAVMYNLLGWLEYISRIQAVALKSFYYESSIHTIHCTVLMLDSPVSSGCTVACTYVGMNADDVVKTVLLHKFSQAARI